MIVYTQSYADNRGAIGKIETPIKMIIQHESDLLEKRGGICNWLFNVEKSNRFGETILGHSSLDVFDAVAEGQGLAERDITSDVYSKFIEHIQFMKEIAISADMIEDANYGIAADAKRRIEAFTRSYYKTINKICETALVNGTSRSVNFRGANVSLSTYDSEPLFSSYHSYDEGSYEQSNYFYGNIFSSGTSTSRAASAAQFEEALGELAVKLRNMKDESGEPLGYTADTIILPGNRPIAETIAKKVCGTPGALGNGYNDINIQYGNWSIIVLPGWQATSDSVMIMSSEANKNLGGNMFFNRIPLTISNWVDNHTGNYIWNGRCRFGVGFGTYKHILLAVDSETEIADAEQL